MMLMKQLYQYNQEYIESYITFIKEKQLEKVLTF